MIQRKQTEPQISRYLHSRGLRLGLPVAGTFELTARCNFDCPMCYVHLKQEDIDAQGRELTAEQWIALARRARDSGMVFVLLTGGEPFVRKDFFEIYHAMKEMGLLVSINSNGSMLHGEIRRKLIEDPPFRINISLYGGSSETYRSMCGQPAFERVAENIRALREAGIDVRLNVSITPDNHQDLERIASKARELEVHAKASAYMYPSIRVNGGKFGCGNRLSPEEAARCAVRWDLQRFTPEEFAARARAMARLETLSEGECSVDPDEGVGCRAGRTSLWVTWDGRMLPCGMMPYPAVRPLEMGFEVAWRQLREQTALIRLPRECGVCPKRQVCPVCAAVCVTETGRFDGVPEYVCAMTDGTLRLTQQAYAERTQHEDQERTGQA